MIEGYTSAREFFEAVRDAAMERGRTAAMLDGLRAASGLQAVRYDKIGIKIMRPSDDGAGPICERMDMEELYARRMADDEALLDRAALVLYGTDNAGGVASLLGSGVADAVFLRYVLVVKWPQVEAWTGHGRRWCLDAIERACDLLDALGADAVIEGRGLAED